MLVMRYQKVTMHLIISVGALDSNILLLIWSMLQSLRLLLQ